MKPAARLTKAAAIDALEERLAWGRRLQERALDGEQDLAEALVERLEWHVSVTQLLAGIPKGIQAVADFNRGGSTGSLALQPPPAEEARLFRQVLSQQLISLERTLARVRKSGTQLLG